MRHQPVSFLVKSWGNFCSSFSTYATDGMTKTFEIRHPKVVDVFADETKETVGNDTKKNS